MSDAITERPEVTAQRRQSRIIYAILAGLMAIFLLFELKLPFLVGPQARGLYEAVEKVPAQKPILLVLNWAPGTYGENYPQTEALIQHFFLARKPFAIFGIDPVGPSLGQEIAARQAERLGRTYGVDWVNIGYRPLQLPMILGMTRDLPGTLKRDAQGTELATLPLMRGVHSARDLGMIIDVTPSATLDIWIQYFHGAVGTPVGYAPTAVMAPEAYPYLQSKQIVGMLAGIKGAAEYAALLQQRPDASLAWKYPPMRAMNAVSIAHVLIVVLIVLGNYQYFTRHRRREEQA
ncbi:MAG: hypothetical protein GX774_10145 [Armatimonadetes bacterium]|jgi:hypothetical protein|nr:hypothetical protein [Armatimonadota bacterium]